MVGIEEGELEGRWKKCRKGIRSDRRERCSPCTLPAATGPHRPRRLS